MEESVYSVPENARIRGSGVRYLGVEHLFGISRKVAIFI